MGMSSDPFSSLAAEARAFDIADPGSLQALDGGGLPTAWVGRATIGGRSALLALTDGHQRGGTIGISEAKLLGQLASAIAKAPPEIIVVCWDTGGVRVEEGPVALAAASAFGVSLARASLSGVSLAAVVSGPRGCFGAPAVIAALSQRVILTEDAHWGLTGPRLLQVHEQPAAEEIGLSSTSARHRFREGHASLIVGDSGKDIREALVDFAQRQRRSPDPLEVLQSCVARIDRLVAKLQASRQGEQNDTAVVEPARRQRDLLRFSFRGHWRPGTPLVRRGLVNAAWGLLDGRPALGIIVGSEGVRRDGVGIEDAYAVAEIVRFAARESHDNPAPILTFLFCQGHAVELSQERSGLHCALAECLRSFVAARMLGHPLMCVLGGGAYGAAYLAFAAPSHRVLAIRGTSVAPMAPRTLAAFRSLRGLREAAETPPQMAELIPEVKIVDSIVRLPTVLRAELDALKQELQSTATAMRNPKRANARRV